MYEKELFDETLDINSTSNYEISIQVSLNGFSFCLLDIHRNKFVMLREYKLSGRDYELSKQIEEIIYKDDFLGKPYHKYRLVYIFDIPSIDGDSDQCRNNAFCTRVDYVFRLLPKRIKTGIHNDITVSDNGNAVYGIPVLPDSFHHLNQPFGMHPLPFRCGQVPSYRGPIFIDRPRRYRWFAIYFPAGSP